MKRLVVLLCIGTVIMYSVRVTRKNDSVSLASGGMSNFIEQSTKSIYEVSPIILFSDLIGACQELCVGYQYKEKNGLHYPSQIWIVPFNAIPFLPNILSEQIYGMSQSELAGGQNYNNYMASQNIFSTFGKHMVSDIYMRWGVIGVILGFLLFGTTVGYYQQRRSDDKKYLITWIMLIGMSVYLSRSSILDIIRPIFYVYLFYYICTKKSIERYEDSNYK